MIFKKKEEQTKCADCGAYIDKINIVPHLSLNNKIKNMAKENTYEMDKGGYFFKKTCALCENKPEYRAFYYPTYMNGDAEWLGDYCKEHKKTDLRKVLSGEIDTRYKVGEGHFKSS